MLSNLAWGEILRGEGIVQDGKPRPAIDVFLKTVKSQRDVLTLLGLQRQIKSLTLKDVLEGCKDAENPISTI